MTKLSSLISGIAAVAVVAIVPTAWAQEIPGFDQVPQEVIFAFDSPGLKLPPAVLRSGLTSRTAQLLGEAFNQPGTLVERRVELVRDLGRSALPEAVPFIQSALADESEQVRATAAWAAGRSRQVELADDLLTRLDDPSPRVRAAVVAAHAALTADRAQASPAVTAGLQDADPAVRMAAVTHVAVAEEAVALRDLLPNLTGSTKLEAIDALARVAAPETVDAVAVLLDDGDIGVRSVALAALGRMAATSHAPRIEAFLTDDHPTIRRAAVGALLGVVQPERAREIGERMLEDRDLSVQTAAAAIVGPVRSEAIARALFDRLASPYLPLHDAALATLAHPADDTIRQIIIARAVQLLDQPDARRREDAAFLLGAYRSDAGIDQLLQLAGSKDSADETVDARMMRQVVVALGLIGDQRAASVLDSIITRGTAFTLAAATGGGNAQDYLAASALTEAVVASGRLGDPQVVQRGVQILRANPEFMPSEIRQAAAWAIGQVGQPGDNALRGPLMGVVELAETPGAAFEAIKAIGRLNLTNSHAELRRAAEQTSDPRVRWIALWAIERLTGETEPYVTPIATESPALIIQDRAAR